MCKMFVYVLKFQGTCERKERKNPKIFTFDFLDFENMGVYFTTDQLNIFVYNSFAAFCHGYLGATPIPYVQDAISNLLNPYMRSTTILFDIHLLFVALCRHVEVVLNETVTFSKLGVGAYYPAFSDGGMIHHDSKLTSLTNMLQYAANGTMLRSIQAKFDITMF